MKAGNLIIEGDTAHYTCIDKGGKQGHRELTQPALNAIKASLAAFGKELATLQRFFKTISEVLRDTLGSQSLSRCHFNFFTA